MTNKVISLEKRKMRKAIEQRKEIILLERTYALNSIRCGDYCPYCNSFVKPDYAEVHVNRHVEAGDGFISSVKHFSERR